ncbi:probable serine incorporator [Phtheirospermum japonicum]|uniref:Probable serine incorporator n=1 Tax=Phtheirospermum japonicum TaxID=374723 RepID=A0A830B5I3_9LAMI|nr:probable serine incorporator [Phtheirospermum japonicum]
MTENKFRENEGEEQSASGQKNIKCSVRKTKSLRARYAYGVVFLLMNIIAWLFRDYGEIFLPMLPYSKACGAEERECNHTMGVLRVSLGCFIIFFLMFLSTCNTRKLDEARNAWHSGWWAVKFVLLLISLVIPFFIPSDYIQLYGELARVGAGIFLILQLISVIELSRGGITIGCLMTEINQAAQSGYLCRYCFTYPLSVALWSCTYFMHRKHRVLSTFSSSPERVFFLRQLLHFVVSDVSDDVRRTAVLALGVCFVF